MTTLISPGRRSSASLQRSIGTRRVINRREPALVGVSERVHRHLVMKAIGIDRAEDRVVLEHQGAVELADVELTLVPGLRDSEQANDAGGRGSAEHVADDARHAGAFHQDVGLQTVEVGDRADVKAGAEAFRQRALRTVFVVVEHVGLESTLHAHHRRQQADRSGAGHQHGARRPHARAAPDALGMIPRLGDDAGRLEQDAESAQVGIDLDRELGLDAKVVGSKAVPVLDAALGVAAVAAHVPFAGGA